jgi:hypothetical protein
MSDLSPPEEEIISDIAHETIESAVVNAVSRAERNERDTEIARSLHLSAGVLHAAAGANKQLFADARDDFDSVIARREAANKQMFADARKAFAIAKAALNKIPYKQQDNSPEKNAESAARQANNAALRDQAAINRLKYIHANELKGKKATRTFGEELYTDEMITSMGSGDRSNARQHGWDSGGGRRRTKNAKYYNKRRGTKRRRSKRHRSKKHRA